MIIFEQDTFHITTKNMSYLIGIRQSTYLEHLYFGKKIRQVPNVEALKEKFGTEYGNSVVSPHGGNLTLDNLCMEYSFGGNGDFRNSSLEMKMPDNSFSNRFYYSGYKIYKGVYEDSELTHMPYGRSTSCEDENLNRGSQSVETLEITLLDHLYKVELVLIYTSFYSSDVISRRSVIHNLGKESIYLHKVMSLQLDLPESDYCLNTYDGMWARERHRNRKQLVSGIYVNDSTNGTSSNRHNPLIILEKHGCTESTGQCIGVNLLYSGNHYEAVEVSGYDKIRIMTGINPHRFQWEVVAGSTFYSPEAILTYSDNGRDSLSHNFHHFIKNHIIPQKWAMKERPILINNWEATYFEFNESKLLKLAKEAKKLGIELFVLDDGWFGNRNDDTSSLGDWTANVKKLGCSLQEFADKINNIGLQFGLWMEPEMISINSELYQQHPEWAVMVPGRENYIGRNQFVLDYTSEEVRTYVITKISKLLDSANIEYVKWDMNRALTDAFSNQLGNRQGEFYHRYVLGLYEVLYQITTKFPDILFESCSAGGNRFDLGMLFYMPQVWTSDNTDANERVFIQEGTSDGYPLLTMGAHVSAVPNHQTLRTISLETRFHVACFGVLGYELDLTKLSIAEKKIVKKQIEFYKEYRKLFQFGTFRKQHMHNQTVVWTVEKEDRTEMIVLVYQQLQIPNYSSDILKVIGLKENSLYEIKARKQAISIKQFGSLVNQVSPVSIQDEGILQSVINKVYMLESEEECYLAYGDLLNNAGIKLKQQFVATGYNENTRVMGDFSTRLYVVKESSKDENKVLE